MTRAGTRTRTISGSESTLSETLSGFITTIFNSTADTSKGIFKTFLESTTVHPTLAQLSQKFYETYTKELRDQPFTQSSYESDTTQRRRHSLTTIDTTTRATKESTADESDNNNAQSKLFAFLLLCALSETLPVTAQVTAYGLVDPKIESLNFKKIGEGARLHAIKIDDPQNKIHLLIDIGCHPDISIAVGSLTGEDSKKTFKHEFYSSLSLSNPENFLDKKNQIILVLDTDTHTHKKVSTHTSPLKTKSTSKNSTEKREAIFKCMQALMTTLKTTKLTDKKEESSLNAAACNIGIFFKDRRTIILEQEKAEAEKAKKTTTAAHQAASAAS